MNHPDVLNELEKQVSLVATLQTVNMTDQEKLDFKQKWPWADLVIGDFEIRVINREKYGLDPQ